MHLTEQILAEPALSARPSGSRGRPALPALCTWWIYWAQQPAGWTAPLAQRLEGRKAPPSSEAPTHCHLPGVPAAPSVGLHLPSPRIPHTFHSWRLSTALLTAVPQRESRSLHHNWGPDSDTHFSPFFTFQ